MTVSQSVSPHARYPDLDYRFLQDLGVTIDGEAIIHGYYLPMLEGRTRVVDLGCGLGGFVKFLRGNGIDAYGVDADPQCVREAHEHDIPVVHDDVLGHLRTVESESLDAVFSAHLVEHLPYEVVLELIELSFRALKPGGRLLLATPNPRALVSHLELYTMHFGHVAMYHPSLLAFFMRYAGFTAIDFGENPISSASNVAAQSPLVRVDRLLRELEAASADPAPMLAQYTPAETVIPEPKNPLRRAIWRVKMGLVKWLVQPYYDHTGADLIRLSANTTGYINSLRLDLITLLETTQRPFESYVVGDKPVL